MTRVAVMGSGSWGTTFAIVLADAGAKVRLWGRNPEICAEISEQHTNTRYLGGTRLPDTVDASTDAAAVLDGADIVVLAIPSQTLRDNLARWAPILPPHAVLVSLMKGVEHGTHLRMSEVVRQVAGVGPERVAVVSGPNLAREIAVRQPTATVVACEDPVAAELVAATCSARYFRPYTNTDVVGVELGGAVKNVIALAVGIAEGRGMGDNTKATIITRGLAETTRLGTALGAHPATLAGLAGLGDLVATCFSPLSRNRTLGAALGRGLDLTQATAVAKHTAEGVRSCGPILELARLHGVDMPITEQIVVIVENEGHVSIRDIAVQLLERPRKPEGV
ncbi:MAG: NAD(P)H-dependent glycerol-3-phosphate dehydrogenase [Kineosporiaceae bacterium]